VDASGVFAVPEEVLSHEIAHAVIFRVLGPNAPALPLWMNEGLAQYESRELTYDDDQLVADTAAEGSLLALTSLSDDFPRGSTAVAYAESSSAVRYMVAKHGRSSPRIMLAELARTGSFDKAMVKATGMTGARFADSWLAKMERKYQGLRITRTITAVISVLMSALAVAAYLVRRKQKIEAAKRWEQEELEEALKKQRGHHWSTHQLRHRDWYD